MEVNIVVSAFSPAPKASSDAPSAGSVLMAFSDMGIRMESDQRIMLLGAFRAHSG
jgi:hypothetical protein